MSDKDTNDQHVDQNTQPPNEIQHMPRKRASYMQRFESFPEFQRPRESVQPVQYPEDPVKRLEAVKEPRIGPWFIKYSE
jgi:hypothetical protein